MLKHIALLLLVGAMVASAQGYDEAGLKAFRAEREKVLLADNGWFTVAGLHFLNPGENKFGSDPLNDIVLDFADVPKQAGVITMNGNTVKNPTLIQPICRFMREKTSRKRSTAMAESRNGTARPSE